MELLNDMALFVEVGKAKSFRGAADALGMANSTLSRRIGVLEKAIGLRLLHRTTRKVELTEAGQIYFERCKRIVDEARLAHEELGDLLAQPSGVLRASFPVDFAVTYLAPAIAAFAQRYPQISFDFDFTPRRVDLVSEPFDVAIRMGASEDSQLISRQLASLPTHLYASPTYLEQWGEPKSPNDLLQRENLNMARHGAWTLQNGQERIEITASKHGRFNLNSMGMMRRLAALGMGIILCPEAIVAEELASGQLRRILPQWQGTPVPVFAITETRLLPAKTQRFIEFLREHLQARSTNQP